MSDLSVFVDESGTQEGSTEYYVVTYVLHDQDEDVSWRFGPYEELLARKGLPYIPFHATPLKRAHDAHAALDLSHRLQRAAILQGKRYSPPARKEEPWPRSSA